jgi:hypothetical protein
MNKLVEYYENIFTKISDAIHHIFLLTIEK